MTGDDRMSRDAVDDVRRGLDEVRREIGRRVFLAAESSQVTLQSFVWSHSHAVLPTYLDVLYVQEHRGRRGDGVVAVRTWLPAAGTSTPDVSHFLRWHLSDFSLERTPLADRSRQEALVASAEAVQNVMTDGLYSAEYTSADGVHGTLARADVPWSATISVVLT